MKVVLRGIKPLDFVSDDGKKVQGTKLYISFAGNGVTGEETSSFFIKSEIALPKLVIGNPYMADFDNRGKLLSIAEA